MITILGAGSWGTAVAIHLARSHPVTLWGHDADKIQQMATVRCNSHYLPDTPFPENLLLNADLEESLQQASIVIAAVPSHAFTHLLSQIQHPIKGLTWLTKGIDPHTHQFLSQLVQARFGEDFPIAVLSGPSFAKEVARGLPTAMTLASEHAEYQKMLHPFFHMHHLRLYLSDDIIGVQWCGAVKNILAIACGISDGLHFGANAKAALITRGLAEMTRLGIVLGGRTDTFTGLAGVGDLVLTCTDDQSRNRRFGILLGQGMTTEAAEKSIGQVVEGKYNAAQVIALAAKHQIDMPICQEVHALLQGHITPKQAVMHLMARPPKVET